LIDPNFDDYISLYEVFSYFGGSTGASGSRRGLDFGYILDNVAFMVDMLWEYTGHGLGSQEVYHDSLCYPLRELAEYANWLVIETRPNGYNPDSSYTWNGIEISDHPRLWISNYRIRFAAILGYAGCVLDDSTYINTALEDLLEFNEPGQLPDNGYYDLYVTNSGVYGEGMNYTNYSCQAFPMFFNSYKRMGLGNLYEHDGIKDVFENSLNLIVPDFNMVSIDDSYFSRSSSPYFFKEIIHYYYQSNTENEEIEWFVSNYYNAFSTYPKPAKVYTAVLSFNPDRNIGTGTLPTNLANGTYSNEEITLLRNPIISFDPTHKYMLDENGTGTTLIINHDNSLNLSNHEHGDQSSFQLYYKGIQLLTDPGYRPDLTDGCFNVGKEWLLSPYAHNLILVNPDTLREIDELNTDYYNVYPYNDPPDSNLYKFESNKRYEPVGYHGTVSENVLMNPCYKNYLISTDEIEHIQIGIVYDHHQEHYDDNATYPNLNPADTICIKRNFYSIDNNSYYVIYDDVKSALHNESNTFCNQLHFAVTELNGPSGSMQDSLSYENNGKFTYLYYSPDLTSDVYLHGAMGSQGNTSQLRARDHLPQGVYLKELENGPEWEHRDLRLFKTTLNNEKFLTVLIPSESSTSPISDTLNGAGYYAVEIYDTSISPTEKSYYAVSDSLLDVSFTDIDVNSDGGFVGLTYRPGYQFDTKITQFIMADGDSLLYDDCILVKCNSSVDEVIATYSGTELSVIVKSDDEYPQYKILRQGVDPEDFSSIGVADQGNGPSNIKHLSYDSDYFYVNWYDFSSGSVNLITPILVPYGETLVIGNGVTINCMNSDIKIEIEGEISIGDGVTFTSPDSVQWDGLYLYNTSETITMNNVTFERGKLYNESLSLDIINSHFTNSGIEQYGDVLTISETDFYNSRVYCDWKPHRSDPPMYTDINISWCNFSNYYNNNPVYIQGYNFYDLSNNTISQCNGGFKIYYSGNPKMCIISNNLIEDNGIGIQLYNSYADITGHNVIRENSYGIVGANKSSITMIGNRDYPLQSIYNNVNEEIVIDQSSYPEKMDCNMIRDDNYDYGTSDQYLIRCARFDGEERSLDAENNNWGSASLNWDEWDGDDRFDPSTAFDYIPVWDPGTPRDNDLEGAKLLYAEADSLIEEEEYEDAKTTYRTIIDLYTLTDYAIYSMRNLLPLETVSGHDFSSLKQYYLTDPNCNINNERTKLSQYLANYCTIKMEQYPEAISFFEAIISDPDTELDSVYAVIDAGYTYLLMENGGKYDYVGKMAELKPRSEKEFRIMRDGLLSELFEIIETEPEEPNVEYVFELKHNYPNPFNSKTTISFSLPLYTQKAELKIYNIKGQLVRILDMDNKSGIGNLTWDGLDSFGKKVGSGIYFYKLTADKKEIVKKMVLMR